VQGGEPEDKEAFSLLEDQGIKLWVEEDIQFQGDTVRLERYTSSSGPLVIAVNAVVR
jgi:hypothetical protein